MKINKINEMSNEDPTGLNPTGYYCNPNGKTLPEKYGIGMIYDLDITNLPTEIDDELVENEIYTHDQTNQVHVTEEYPIFFKFLKDIGLQPNYGKGYRISITG